MKNTSVYILFSILQAGRRAARLRQFIFYLFHLFIVHSVNGVFIPDRMQYQLFLILYIKCGCKRRAPEYNSDIKQTCVYEQYARTHASRIQDHSTYTDTHTQRTNTKQNAHIIFIISRVHFKSQLIVLQRNRRVLIIDMLRHVITDCAIKCLVCPFFYFILFYQMYIRA